MRDRYAVWQGIYELAPVFFIVSIAGWFCEVLYELVVGGNLVNRGLLQGPWLPIYGFGMLAILGAGGRKRAGWLRAFLYAMLLATAMEYLTSVWMEQLFAQRWWDYSGYRFQVNGRVCLVTSLLFGAGGVLGLFVFLPWLRRWLVTWPGRVRSILTWTCGAAMAMDLMITVRRLSG